jgi:hypothetical protein
VRARVYVRLYVGACVRQLGFVCRHAIHATTHTHRTDLAHSLKLIVPLAGAAVESSALTVRGGSEPAICVRPRPAVKSSKLVLPSILLAGPALSALMPMLCAAAGVPPLSMVAAMPSTGAGDKRVPTVSDTHGAKRPVRAGAPLARTPKASAASVTDIPPAATTRTLTAATAAPAATVNTPCKARHAAVSNAPTTATEEQAQIAASAAYTKCAVSVKSSMPSSQAAPPDPHSSKQTVDSTATHSRPGLYLSDISEENDENAEPLSLLSLPTSTPMFMAAHTSSASRPDTFTPNPPLRKALSAPLSPPSHPPPAPPPGAQLLITKIPSLAGPLELGRRHVRPSPSPLRRCTAHAAPPCAGPLSAPTHLTRTELSQPGPAAAQQSEQAKKNEVKDLAVTPPTQTQTQTPPDAFATPVGALLRAAPARKAGAARPISYGPLAFHTPVGLPLSSPPAVTGPPSTPPMTSTDTRVVACPLSPRRCADASPGAGCHPKVCMSE